MQASTVADRAEGKYSNPGPHGLLGLRPTAIPPQIRLPLRRALLLEHRMTCREPICASPHLEETAR